MPGFSAQTGSQHSASAVLWATDPWLGTRVSVCVQSADVGPPLSRYLLSVHCPLHSDTQPTHQLSRGHSRLVNHQMDLYKIFKSVIVYISRRRNNWLCLNIVQGHKVFVPFVWIWDGMRMVNAHWASLYSGCKSKPTVHPLSGASCHRLKLYTWMLCFYWNILWVCNKCRCCRYSVCKLIDTVCRYCCRYWGCFIIISICILGGALFYIRKDWSHPRMDTL